MRHDQALAAALAGGPLPPEVALHVRECASCREELRSLEALESRLRSAAPESEDPAWEARLVRRLASSPSDRGRTLLRAAAGLLLAGSLVVGLYWATARPEASRSEAEIASAAPGRVSPNELRALLSSPEDSTSALLDLTGQVSEEMPQSPPASLREYLGTADSGGWNG